jgi:hypothetical protein
LLDTTMRKQTQIFEITFSLHKKQWTQ